MANKPWEANAACATNPTANPEWWFSSDDLEKRWAMEICGGCPVAYECLMAGLEEDELYGIRGGVDLAQPNRDRRMARKRARDFHQQ